VGDVAAPVRVLTAITGADWESVLVRSVERAAGAVVARRCVDVADLLASAAAGQGDVVLLSGELRRLDRDVVGRLTESEVAVVGVISAGDEVAEARLRHLGVSHTVPADAEPQALSDAMRAALARPAPAARPRSRDAAGTDGDTPAISPGPSPADAGLLIAVWGPCGAPGRTTLAVNVAAESAGLGRSTLLADADTYGASVAQVLGLLDEAPGLAAASRAANNGQLDAAALARHARRITPELRVLTGITRPERWPEIRPSSLDVVWDLASATSEVTVVDCGFSLEQDESLSFDTAAPRRNGATLTTLEKADVVLVVGSADPVGLGRLVRGLSELDEAVPGSRREVVINRVRESVAGAHPQRAIADALGRFAAVTPSAFVPDDPRAVDAALAAGLTLAEAEPRSAARQAIQRLTRHLLGLVETPSRSGFRRVLPRRT
jgi:MinD-like ATPase involved in chromosome partitioning or flagellar assembly